MDKKEWFEQWFDSPYHHLLYQNRDDVEAKAFVEKLLTYLRVPNGSRILDIACGDGRHAQYLQQGNNDVTGIDLSARRIAVAKELENENLHFYIQDMRQVFRSNYFDYAFNFFTSFGYFQNYRDNVIAARAFASALKPGGKLLLDYMNIHLLKDRLVPEDIVVSQDIEFHIERKMHAGKVLKDITFIDREGKRRQYQENVSGFDLQDFEKIFADTDLKLEETFGNYELQPFDVAHSPRLILLFEKTGA